MLCNQDYMELPKVTVLMATFNGIRWVKEQIESIKLQKSVHVNLVISDDGSTDGTYEWLEELARTNENIELHCNNSSTRGAAGNFYHLIENINMDSSDYIALADQDDIWFEDKLNNQIQSLKLTSSDGVSSDVIAFWPDGKKERIIKSDEMKKFDFLFESAGPGCSYIFTPGLFTLIKKSLEKLKKEDRPDLHDWFVYAVARANKKNWTIDPVPSLKYRQHENNVMGVNRGWQAKLNRLSKINDGWYRQEVIKISRIVEKMTSDEEVLNVCRIVSADTFANRLKLMALLPETRRAKMDRVMLYCACGLFLF